MATDIVLNRVVLSYPHLIAPWAARSDQTPTYNCALIIPADFAQWQEMQQCVQNCILNKFGAQPPANLKLPWLNRYLQPNVLTDGPHQGCYTMNCKSDSKPKLVDPHVKDVPDLTAKEMFFPGSIVNVYVNFYAYDTSGNRGVGTGLRMVQMVDNVNVTRLGEGSGKAPGEVFQTVPGAPAPLVPTPASPEGPAGPAGTGAPWGAPAPGVQVPTPAVGMPPGAVPPLPDFLS